MTTQIPPSALAAALTETYWQRRRGARARAFAARLRDVASAARRVLAAALLVGVQATLFLLAAVRYAVGGDRATAVLLAAGCVGTALVAAGLVRRSRVAYVMTLSYAAVGVVLTAAGEHRPAIGALVVLALLADPRYFFRR